MGTSKIEKRWDKNVFAHVLVASYLPFYLVLFVIGLYVYIYVCVAGSFAFIAAYVATAIERTETVSAARRDATGQGIIIVVSIMATVNGCGEAMYDAAPTMLSFLSAILRQNYSILPWEN